MQIDEKWLEFATDRQAEVIRTVIAEGSQAAAARKLGVRRDSVKKAIEAAKARATRQGHSPAHDMTHTAPDGYHVKGVSTYYNKEGKPAGQWVKTSVDAERQAEFIRASFAALIDDLPQAMPEPAPTAALDKLMSAYVIGDAHIGMRAWGEEAGGDWDMAIGERVQCAAMASLVAASPASHRAIIINTGDLLHADNMDGVTTRSGHILDTDGRYAKMIRVGIKVMRQCITSALQKHQTVEVINAIGNHDDTGAIWLSEALRHIYENEPRVKINTSPAAFMYVEHGKVLLGVHHGHSCKTERLPGVMAADQAQAWGRTEFRHWLIGHVHHQSVKEYAGVTVESFNTLTAKDAYAAWGGYRARQQMTCITYHAEYGEVARNLVNPKMIGE